MAKRNIMIQEQVLAMILAATGVLPDSLTRFSMRTGTVNSRRGEGGRLVGTAAVDQQEQELLQQVMQYVWRMASYMSNYSSHSSLEWRHISTYINSLEWRHISTNIYSLEWRHISTCINSLEWRHISTYINSLAWRHTSIYAITLLYTQNGSTPPSRKLLET